jgi:hypothetical protein
VTGRVHEHGARTVHQISARDDLPPVLQHVFELSLPGRCHAPEDREDGAHRDIEIDVGRSVERVEYEHVVAGRILIRNWNQILLLFRRHAAQPPGVIVELVERTLRVHVELLYFFALHVLVSRGTENIGEAGALRAACDQLGGQRDVVEKTRESAGGVGETLLLPQNVTLDGDDA